MVIDCIGFVPADPVFFKDTTLHPNDECFAHYYENLRRALEPYV